MTFSKRIDSDYNWLHCHHKVVKIPAGVQIELIKRRETDYLKLRREYEESVMQSDAMISQMKKKHQDQINELVEQVSLCLAYLPLLTPLSLNEQILEQF